jgi:ornithine carbamoyltransferase
MDLLGLRDVEGKWIRQIIADSISVKADIDAYRKSLDGRILAMLFMKPSTRTRVSFESGMIQLGGHAIYLDLRTTNFTKGALRDEVKCVDRYSDIIMARVFRNAEIREIADSAQKPVINALCDTEHPCQGLADIQTVYEKLGTYNFKLAYVGDGNNVCNSLIWGCCKVGAKISVATPKGFEPDAAAVEFGLKNGLTLHNDPKQAVEGADVVYTDVWVSMGKEEEKERRMAAFKGYTVDEGLLGKAYFMHCLPALRGIEVTDGVMDSKRSIIFDQAENRMHAQKALMLRLLGRKV